MQKRTFAACSSYRTETDFVLCLSKMLNDDGILFETFEGEIVQLCETRMRRIQIVLL